MAETFFKIGPIDFRSDRLLLIAGPCLAESRDLCFEVAETMAGIAEELGVDYVFKASYDKANRTSVESKRGFGMQEGLSILTAVREQFGMPVTTDVHLPNDAAVVGRSVDLMQVPAFLSRQTDLLEACAHTGKPVNVKKGQFLAPNDAQNIVHKLQSFGANGVMLTERGTTFGYNTLIVDMPGLETMRSFGVPVCFDATHSAQRPGGSGTASSGNREAIPALSRAAAAVGIQALFMEVHPDPARALSDSATQWPLGQAKDLLAKVLKIWHAAR